jgi:hypothetical protein
VRSLRLLSLNATSVASLRALAGLEQLRHLLVCNAPRLESVEGLESLEALQRVLLWDLKRLTDVSSVGRLSQLRGLQCGGGMWTTLQLETLAPLAGLTRIEYLDCLPPGRATVPWPRSMDCKPCGTWRSPIGIAPRNSPLLLPPYLKRRAAASVHIGRRPPFRANPAARPDCWRRVCGVGLFAPHATRNVYGVAGSGLQPSLTSLGREGGHRD